MKAFLISLVFILFSLAIYGQNPNPDLIVTTGGDSLNCKIIEVTAGEIQFRFGTGGIIAIPRSDVISHQYNFEPAQAVTTRAVQPTATTTAQPAATTDVQPETTTIVNGGSVKVSKQTSYPPAFLAFTAEAGAFGSISLGEIKSGIAGGFGADAAYFFNQRIGAGLKLNTGICEVDFGDAIYNEVITFLGPALYGRFGNERIAFAAGTAVGLLLWKWNFRNEQKTDTSVGVIISGGINFMITQNFGIGMNLQSIIGSVENANGEERKPAGIGATMGFNFRF